MAVTPSMTIFEPKGFFQNLQYAEYTLGIFLKKIFGLMNCIHVTPGPFSIYRKWFFDKYGGYDTNNLTEDIEIALRIQKYGYKIENSMSSLVYTIAPNTFMGLLKQRIRWYFGFTQNVLNYKELFNPKYGYLAVLMLPIAFISVFFSILLFLYFMYQNIQYLMDRIVQFSVIGNSLFTVEFQNFKFSYLWDIIVNTFTNPLILILLVSVAFTLATLIIAKRKSGDKRNMVLATIYFFFTYWFFYALWWVYAFIYKGFGGKIGWGKRKH
jgi:cellulose synthase/poly-beta-1,6-N-acetylglucosamine synthase-like glycosyltransferase